MDLLRRVEEMKYEFIKRFGSDYQPTYLYWERELSIDYISANPDLNLFLDAINTGHACYLGMHIKSKPSFFNAMYFDKNPIIIWHVEKDLNDCKEGYVSLFTEIRYVRCNKKGEIIL